MIHGLYSNEMVEFAYRSPILSVALDPHYARSKKRSFACGGRAGSLVLNVKGTPRPSRAQCCRCGGALVQDSCLLVCVCVCAAGFFRSSNNVIHAAEGPIYAIAWCGSLIAWANDIGTHRTQWQARTLCDAPYSRDSLRLTHAPAGVKIYDVNTEQRITFIDRPKGSPKADLYRCSLCWEDPHTLLIGWADMVRIAVIKARCPPLSLHFSSSGGGGGSHTIEELTFARTTGTSGAHPAHSSTHALRRNC